jgi:small-conductance mechanosensitive channel
MAIPPIAPVPGSTTRARIFGRGRLVFLLVLFALLILCAAFSWTTRDAMAHFSFLNGQGGSRAPVDGKKTLVDLSPWQTAQALAPLAVTAEETAYARDAERLADHEVDQAFALALRQANLRAQHRTLTGEALALSQKVSQLQGLIKEDQAQVQSLTAKSGSPTAPAKGDAQPAPGNDDLEVAKAQLGLDSDELADAQRDLERASGDDSSRIQGELAAHEAAMAKYDSELHGDGQIAVLSAAQHGTLAARLKSWFSQRDRYQLIQQAMQQAQADISSLTTEHNTLEAKANAGKPGAGSDAADHAAMLANIKDRSVERQVLGIYDDRIQTEQQLATVYSKWSSQVLLQHRIVLHLILQSLALIVFILISMVLCDALVRRLMAHPVLDRRQMQTLRTILELGIQALGALLILLVVFGSPQQMSTVLGLATAGLTIALQDFILAFFGWFVLMGKNGIRIGDWVEINGVGGEVTEIGLIYTSLLETGNLADKGHPTGRRITFINSFAIRGQYFNFSTAGQWMWDEITVSLPPSDDLHAMVERIHKAVLEETEENARLAEQEWKRGTRGDGLSRFSATPVVNLRPSGSGVDIEVRYVTRASGRFEVRNRLYQQVIDLLHQSPSPAPTQHTQAVGTT